MKKFVFSLEKVLNVKQQMLEVKKNEMLNIENEIREIERQEELVKRKFKDNDLKLKEEFSKGTTPDKVMTYKMYARSLISKENTLVYEKAEKLKLKVKKQAELIEVKTEISGLEKLQEKQVAEYKYSLKKEQERDIEEYVNQKSAAQFSASDI